MMKHPPKCVYCDRTSDQVPLLQLQFHSVDAWICSQHLPILIHKPEKLAGKLPGAESLEGSDHEH